MYGKNHFEESKKQIGKSVAKKMKGRHWYNNSEKEILSFKCPENYKLGRLTK